MRHTRKDVIARTRREFARLDRVVTRLRPADWTRRVPRPPTRDPWTVKDALAHILYWKEHTARVIRGERRLPEMRGLDIEGINRLVYQRWRRRRPAEVLAWHRQVHRRRDADAPADAGRVVRPARAFGRVAGGLRRALGGSPGEGHRGRPSRPSAAPRRRYQGPWARAEDDRSTLSRFPHARSIWRRSSDPARWPCWAPPIAHRRAG